MQYVILIATSLHVLAAIFWAGSTMGLSASGSMPGKSLFLRQMAAATAAVLAGGYLWCKVHAGVFQATEKALAAGAACAVLAFAMQLAIAGPAVWKLHRETGSTEKAGERILVAYRLASALLVVAAVMMGASKYAGVLGG
ncbi:hypothetical protein ACO0LO_16280 [Undibacterium sp. TJN25]|uniref:hypothetical protein n=1 Tax=Undibacterium sp. TJN25 TaxID=3413056 RepID=UPI003BF06085